MRKRITSLKYTKFLFMTLLLISNCFKSNWSKQSCHDIQILEIPIDNHAMTRDQPVVQILVLLLWSSVWKYFLKEKLK